MAALLEAINVKRKSLFEHENTPYYCMDSDISSPTARGGQTLVRLKMRNLLTNAVFEKTFKAGDKFKEPDLELVPATFLYTDGDGYHFLDQQSFETLTLTEGMIGAIKIAQASAVRLLKGEVAARPVLGSWQALIDYLHVAMAHRMNESARVLHLNSRNMLIRDELISEGSVDQAAVYVREVARRALELGSAAIILVHNHPSGDPSPSRQDIALTKEIVAALKPFGIQVHDHVVIGASGHASLRGLGLM